MHKSVIATSAMIVLALAVPLSARADFNYPDFSNTSGLKLNGDATVASNQLQLTYSSGNSAGSVFTTNQVALGSNATFSTHFQFQITNPGGVSDGDGQGADGFVFVLQTVSNNVGSAGQGIGYGGIAPSLGIEFDTYQNASPYLGPYNGDPTGNHVGININGSLTSIATANESTRFNNGQVWDAWITYDGSTNLLNAYWSMNGSIPAIPGLSATVNLAEIIGQNAGYVGFTSATGAAWENHNILNWQFSQTIAVPEPSSLLMFGIGIVGVAWKLRRRR
jgi:hypothetical protein